jgi:hypothetical protein
MSDDPESAPGRLATDREAERNEPGGDDREAEVIEGCGEQLNSGIVDGMHSDTTYRIDV